MGNSNIRATVSPIIPKGSASPSRVNAPPSIRSPAGIRLLGGDLSNSLAGDLESLNATINSLHLSAQGSPGISQILLTNQAGQVTAAFGPVTFEGVQYTNFLSEIHVGDPLLTHDPTKALFNANLDGSVTVGENGWLEVLDPFGNDAAWIGTQFETLNVTGAVDNGAGLIRLTVTAHTLITGNRARVQFVGGVSNATGTWTVTVIGANTLDLQGSVWAGVYTFGGMIDRVLQVSGATNAAGLIRIKTSIAHGYESGTKVNIPAPGPGGVPAAVGQWVISVPATLAVTGAVNNGAGLIRLTVPGHNFTTGDVPQVLNVGGVPNANGYHAVTVIDATHVDLQSTLFAGPYTAGGTITFLHANYFSLVGSTFAGAYTAGGTVIQYFAGMLAQTIAIGPSFQDYRLRAFPSGDLRIHNASIELTSNTGQILIDPVTNTISLKSTTTLAEIILDAAVPSMTLFDQLGAATVTIEILMDVIGPLAISAATNAAPVVLTVVGNTYLSGDTILIAGATGNTAINGYRIVKDLGTAGANTFHITDLQNNPVNGNGGYAGAATATRYWAGLLAQTLALGASFDSYSLRFFADGSLKINNASIDTAIITNSSINGGGFTGTATVRNAAGTGTSSFVITNGLVTSYTP